MTPSTTSRRDFGIAVPFGGGGIVIRDKVAISLEIQAVRRA